VRCAMRWARARRAAGCSCHAGRSSVSAITQRGWSPVDNSRGGRREGSTRVKTCPIRPERGVDAHMGPVCRLRRLVLGFVVLVAVWSAPAVASAVDYYLPWTQGSTVLCTQGNGGAVSHTGATGRYAWDFSFTFGAPVRAAAPGTVIALRQDAADFVPDPNMSTPANYVLIAHSDGTRTGYIHLRYNSLPPDIQVGAAVRQGQIIGGAGSSGFSSGVHLHFNHYDATGASIPLSFVEAGVPVSGTRYTSANAEAGAPAPASITIRASATSARIGGAPILSGAVSPTGMIGRNIVVWVKKPGKAYYSYSSNRTVYSLYGGAAWYYKYTFKKGMTKGVYYFKASAPAPGFASSAGFATSTSSVISIRLK
jgi:murein DD-endopeptidase MepM/ murein hydrolase activator NlpD